MTRTIFFTAGIMLSAILITGCQKPSEVTGEVSPSRSDSSTPILHAPPSNVSPEVKARIEQEQAQFRQRSEEQARQSATQVVPKK